ncbi:MAG: Asp23/Gls24 family envelope stress response protein [Eubacterium sp.]
MEEEERQDIAESLMELIAETAESVDGVSSMCSTLTEAIADNLPMSRKPRVRGVKLDERGENIIADIYLNAEYGQSIPELAWNVQNAVNSRVSEEFSIKLKKINIHVQGVTSRQSQNEEEEQE